MFDVFHVWSAPKSRAWSVSRLRDPRSKWLASSGGD